MSDQPRNLSEISHLFLSGVRQKQGASRSLRTPPRTDLTIDLTPEEFAEVFGEKPAPNAAPAGPLRAVLASHLGARQLSRVQEYAASICQPGKRVGLIAVDGSEFRLSIFEHNPNPQPQPIHAQETDSLDARKMSQALEELAWDVDNWLLLLPSLRVPEARSLLRDVAHWTVLTTCNPDGIVACYRTLKGLSDLHHPRLTLAALDAADADDAANAHQRLGSVCRQFLGWDVEDESPVHPTGGISEYIVLWHCATRDKAALATAPQWQVVAEFLKRPKAARIAPQHAEAAAPPPPQMPAIPLPAPAPIPAPAAQSMLPEVIDLPAGQESAPAIVAAVLRGSHELVECPVKPPMCPDASLAVSRDRRLVLLAVARQGLCDLRDIGRAYQWLIENRALVGMAVPQLSIDAHQLPNLQLLVDHADISAQLLQPILQSPSVSVHAYRKLRWGDKTGLLLEAA